MPAVGVLGSGAVGQAIARRAAEVGWEVTVGARRADSPGLSALAADPVQTGSYADAAASAPLLVNATNGVGSLEALNSVGPELLAGKVILDLANELRAVGDGFPVPVARAESSLGQRIQTAFPEAHVVKTLNTMNSSIMVRPALIPGDHLAFLSGDDADAKRAVSELLRAFGWRDEQLLDLGGIDTAAATELMMAVWMRVTLARGAGAPRFNWAVLDAAE